MCDHSHPNQTPAGLHKRVTAALTFIALWFGFAPTAFAQAHDLNDLAKQFSNTLENAQVHTVIISDFVDDKGRVSLQGVLLGDRLWFALLQSQKNFQTLNRDLLRSHLDNLAPSTSNRLDKREREAARAAGAEVLIAGKLQQQEKAFALMASLVDALTGKQFEQRTVLLPRSPALDELAGEFVQPDGPIYLLGQSGISTPSCAYCPNPVYTEDARKHQLEGTVVIETIIDPSGRTRRVWEAKGLGDGLTQQAIEIVRQWHFNPANVPKVGAVTIMAPVDVAFSLH
jgi:TonB family protein